MSKMIKDYDQITAYHYASYRPLLHTKILESYLPNHEKVDLGLDIGCGTGQSAISLSAFCKKVIGVDPSQEMIQKSIEHPSVTYQTMKNNVLDFNDDSFDIITFAGSLFYAKSQEILNESIRVSKTNTRVIAYDFEILLSPIFKLLGAVEETLIASNYNHEENFTGLQTAAITLNEQFKQAIDLEITIPDLVNLLLSSKEDYAKLSNTYGPENLFELLIQQLQNKLESENTTLKANTYLTAYTVMK